MATHNDLHQLVGRRGLMRSGEMNVPVEVTDARERFGTVDVQVEPIGGTGFQWIQRDRLILTDEGNS